MFAAWLKTEPWPNESQLVSRENFMFKCLPVCSGALDKCAPVLLAVACC